MVDSAALAGKSRSDALTTILGCLKDENPDIAASALVSDDGLLLAGALPDESEETRIGGMSATLLTLGARAAKDLGLGDLQQTLVRGEDGCAVLVGASEGTVMLSLTRKEAKLGLVFLDMMRAVEHIRRVL